MPNSPPPASAGIGSRKINARTNTLPALIAPFETKGGDATRRGDVRNRGINKTRLPRIMNSPPLQPMQELRHNNRHSSLGDESWHSLLPVINGKSLTATHAPPLWKSVAGC